jgi:ACR3 family arsenite transporter
MICPMMVNISLEHLKKVKGSLKPLIASLFLNFVYTPVVIYFLSLLFIKNPKIKLALLLLAIAPSSSMGLGYIGLAEGHLLTGAIIVAFAFIFSIFVYPFLASLFAGCANLTIPSSFILKNLFWILVFPFLLGIITREYICLLYTSPSPRD